MQTPNLTIGRLAKAANVGIETIRYYQRRALLPEPEPEGAFRYYPAALIERIRFIKRAQELGFSLEEIGALLKLNDGADRRSIRNVASDRLNNIRQKISDLKRMEVVLSHLIQDCAATNGSHACPIISALSGETTKS